MRKYKALFALFASILVTVCIPCKTAEASQATSFTYTADENGYYTRTQDAYLPDKTITELGLSKPEDIYIDKHNRIYIADTGNKRIVVYDIEQGKASAVLEYDGFVTPRGVFVTKDGDLYVADAGAKKVFRFDPQLQLSEEFAKPSTPAFQDTNFEPMRIAVDNGGNMYIISEGVYNGVIQLAHTGEFLGYFTVNKTTLTLSQAVQRMLFNREQLANLVDNVPLTFSNVFVDREGIVYTTTMGKNNGGLKKHDTAGGNMFKTPVFSYDNLSDVFVDEQGIIYTCTSTGYISIYSPGGEFIFEFGASFFAEDIAGIFVSLPGVAVDADRNIWTVDGEKGYLQSFQPTEYALMVYGATGLYEEGRYGEAMEKWNEVLRLNQMSILAHDGVGKAYLRSQKYEDAMEHFKVSGNRKYYSEAFWEVRNVWIQKYLPFFFFALLAFLVLNGIVKRVDKKKKIRAAKAKLGGIIYGLPVLGDVLYAFRVPRHPLDRYYDIRVRKQGSTAGASILYILFFAAYMLYQTGKGFIYQYVAVEDMDINAVIIGFFVILLLFIICNFLVTSINDGDGTLKQVYMIPAYGSVPALVSMVLITVLSFGMTYNESFLLTIILMIGVVWSVVSIFIGLQTVHDYSLKETVKSIILTVVFMIIAAIISIIVVIMWEKVWQFLLTIGKEAVRNVLD